MDQDVPPTSVAIVPVSLEFNGVRITLSLPESKRARTTTTPTKDLTEAPPIPAVPSVAFHPGAKHNTKLEPLKVVRDGSRLKCGDNYYRMDSSVRDTCDRMKDKAEWWAAEPGNAGYAMAVLKQVNELLANTTNGDEDISPELDVVIDQLQSFYDAHPELQKRIDSLDYICARAFDKFIDVLIDIFIDLDNKRPYSDAKSVLHALTTFGYVYLRLIKKGLTLGDVIGW